MNGLQMLHDFFSGLGDQINAEANRADETSRESSLFCGFVDVKLYSL